MAIDFPNSPTNGQTYTVGERTWLYDGAKWMLVLDPQPTELLSSNVSGALLTMEMM